MFLRPFRRRWQFGRLLLALWLAATLAAPTQASQPSSVSLTPAAATVLEVVVPSTYDNNWANYTDLGTQIRLQVPSTYDPAQPTPLVIALHDWLDTRAVILGDYAAAAEAKGWLLAAPEMHGEVNIGANAGAQVMGSPASVQDVVDTISYMKATYNVDANRVYLIGYGMGALTAYLAAGRFPHLIAGLTADSGATDLLEWEYASRSVCNGGVPCLTPNAGLNASIRQECGTYIEPFHYPDQPRRPSQSPYEYDRRSPRAMAANLKYVPTLILHSKQDTFIHWHQAEDMYWAIMEHNPPAGQLKLEEFTGTHNTRRPDFANYTLTWLGGFQRTPGWMPNDNALRLPLTGQVWWGVIEQPYNYLATIWNSKFDVATGRITAQIENTDDNLNTNYTVGFGFDLAAIGLPTGGYYLLETLEKDTLKYSQQFVVPVAGMVRFQLTEGSYSLQLTANAPMPQVTVVTLQQELNGYKGVKDTRLFSWKPTSTYGHISELSIQHDKQLPSSTGLFQFDLSKLPAGAQIHMAALGVRFTSGPNNVNRMLTRTFAMNRPWRDMEANWERAAAGTAWRKPGAEGVPQDHAALSTDLRYVFAPEANRFWGWDVTPLAASWLATPATNYGVMLRSAPLSSDIGATNDWYNFAASEWGPVDERPRLTVIYSLPNGPVTPPTPTPTPTPGPSPTPTLSPTPTPTRTPVPPPPVMGWTKAYTDTRLAWNDILFPSANIGYALGSHPNWTFSGDGLPTLIKTTDGGKSWNLANTFKNYTSRWLRGMDCKDNNNCYVVGRGGTVLRTSDGGAAWKQLVPPNYGGYLYDAQYTGVGDTVVVGATCGGTDPTSPPGFFRTQDGKTLEPIPVTGCSVKWDIDCPEPGICYAASKLNRVYRSVDNGGVWAFRVPGNGYSLNSISCTDKRTCWVAGNAGNIWRTTDMGQTWERQASHIPAGFIFWRIRMVDAYRGFAVGCSDDLGNPGDPNYDALECDPSAIGVAYMTENGTHWTRLPDFTQKGLRSLAVLGQYDVYAGDEGGVLWHYAPVKQDPTPTPTATPTSTATATATATSDADGDAYGHGHRDADADGDADGHAN